MANIKSLVSEFRRRRVFRTGGVYIVAAWAILQVADLAFESFGIPEAALQFVWLTAAAGLPIALLVGWRYDITANGIIRTTAATGEEDLGLKRPDYLILSSLSVVAIATLVGAFSEIRDVSVRSGDNWFSDSANVTTIAVLPIENLSGDSGQDFLGAGLHDALITTLSRVSQLRVTSRYSSRQVPRGSAIEEIGEVLGVEKLLSGSVVRDGERVRINVSLIDVSTERALWSQSFTRAISGMIDVQNEIANTVAREVSVTLTPQAMALLGPAARADADAYEAYLRGMMQLRKESPRGYRNAIRILTEAVEESPTSALAYAGLALAYAKLGHNPFPTKGASLRAKEAVERALELDPDLPEAHLADGMVKAYYDWDFPGAETSYLRALELSPSLIDAHYHYAWLLELLHRNEEALYHGELTKELNPLSAFYTAWLAYQYVDDGQFERAIEEAKVTLDLSPGYPVAEMALGFALDGLGREEEALVVHNELSGSRFWGWVPMMTLAKTGRDDDVMAIATNVTGNTSNEFTLALTWCAMRAATECLASIEASRESRHPWYPWLVNWFEPMYFLHGEPALQAWASELGVPMPELEPDRMYSTR